MTARDVELVPSYLASVRLLVEAISGHCPVDLFNRIARLAIFDKTNAAVRLTLAPCQTIFPTIFIRHCTQELYRSYADTTRRSGLVNSGLFGYPGKSFNNRRG